MATKFFNVKQRIIGQIKYRPTLSSWEGTIKAAHLLEDNYAHWKIQDMQNVTLTSPDEKKLLQIAYNNFLYQNEDSGNTSELLSHSEKVFKGIQKDLKEILHIGFRNMQILGSNFEFQELVKVLFDKLYGSKNQIMEISCDEPRDIAYILDGVKDGFLNHVRLGPTTKEEALSRFDPQFNDHDIEKSDFKSYLFIDIDTYVQKDIITDNTIKILTSLIRENNRIIKEYTDFLLN